MKRSRIDTDLLKTFVQPVGKALALADWCNRYNWKPSEARIAWNSLETQGLIVMLRSGWVTTSEGRRRLEAA